MEKFIAIYHTPDKAAMQTYEMASKQKAWMTDDMAINCDDKLAEMGSLLANGQSITTNGICSSTTGA